jgi:hypothetical protein
MHLFAKLALRSDAEAIAHPQDPDGELGIDKRPSSVAVEMDKVGADPGRSTNRSMERSRWFYGT